MTNHKAHCQFESNQNIQYFWRHMTCCLPGSSPNRHFEHREGPGDKVVDLKQLCHQSERMLYAPKFETKMYYRSSNCSLSNCKVVQKEDFRGFIGHVFISFVFPQFSITGYSFHSVFHSFHWLMDSMNWSALHVWVFIAQLVEPCSANAETMGLNPVEAPKIFFSGYFAIF